MRSHSNVTLCCEKCEKKFHNGRKDSLKIHMLRVHNVEQKKKKSKNIDSKKNVKNEIGFTGWKQCHFEILMCKN